MSNALFWALVTAGVLFVAVLIVFGYYYWTFVIAPGMERGWRLFTPEDQDGK